MKSFNWTAATDDERNALCASFMPPSNINPLRAWRLAWRFEDEEKHQQEIEISDLMVKDREEAEAWLEKVRGDRKMWDRVFDKKRPWSFRHQYFIKEITWHQRYCQTPGGAMGLLLHLGAEKAVIFQIMEDKGQWYVKLEGGDFPEAFHCWAPTFPAAACMAFLEANGVAVEVEDAA